MTNNIRSTLETLKQQLVSMESMAGEITASIQRLIRDTEALKTVFFQRYVEQLKQIAVRDKGMSCLFRDREKVKAGFLVGAGSFLVGALISRKLSNATFAGMSGLNGMVKRLGESNWCLIFGKRISVVPEDMIPDGARWIPLRGFYEKMGKLYEEALAKNRLSSLDDIIRELI